MSKKEAGDDAGVTAEFNATQYAILAESQRRKAAAEQERSRFAILREENAALRKEADASAREGFEVAEYLRREILAKDERIAQLEMHIEQQEAKYAEDTAALRAESAEAVKRAAEEGDRKEAAVRAALADAQEQLGVVLSFKLRKEAVEAELTAAQEAKTKLQMQLIQQGQQAERQRMAASAALHAEYEARLAELRATAEADIGTRLDAAMQRILAANKSMEAELALHIAETAALQKEKGVLEAERARLAREVALKTDMERQYAKRSGTQSRDIKAQQARVSALEASLQAVVRDFERERAEASVAAAAAAAGAEREAGVLRRALVLRTRELKQMRRVAAEVLGQRSDVEAFLLSSIYQVREEVRKEKAAAAAAAAAAAKVDETAAAGGEAGQAGTAEDAEGRRKAVDEALKAGKPVDIRDLSWDDREKVLRLLFARINNNAQHPSYFAKLPPHSFTIAPAEPAELRGAVTDAGPAPVS